MAGWDFLSAHRYSALFVIALGVLLRVLYFSVIPYASGGAEAERVAIAFATGRGFADAFFVGSGPTAHLTPGTPLLAGYVYAWLGVQSAASNRVLVAWSLACFALSAWLLNRLFERLGSPAPARLLGLCVVCLMPVFLVHETMMFRFWEGQIAFSLLLLSLLAAVGAAKARSGPGGVLLTAILNGATFLINPISGLAAVAAHLSALAGDKAWRRMILHLVLMAAVVAPPMALWAARNQAVLGAPVLLRDNAGLELSFKNNDDVLRHGATQSILDAKHRALHPADGAAGAQRLRQVGEYAYFQELQHQVFAWIGTHPIGFVVIALRGWWEFFFPATFNFSAGTAWPRALFVWTIDAVGIGALCWALAKRRRGWLQVAVVVAAISAAYAPFIYIWRYHYPVYNLLVFAACYGAWAVMGWASRRGAWDAIERR